MNVISRFSPSNLFFTTQDSIQLHALLGTEQLAAFNYHISCRPPPQLPPPAKIQNELFSISARTEINLESLNWQQILLRKGLLYRDYKVGVVLDTCILYSYCRPGKETLRNVRKDLRRLSCHAMCLLLLALQSDTVLQMSKVLYLNSLTSKGRILGECYQLLWACLW